MPARRPLALLAPLALSLAPLPALAHFGLLVADRSALADQQAASVKVTAAFCHPMEQVGMTMARPERFIVSAGGQSQNLAGALAPARVLGKEAWSFEWKPRRPGLYQLAFVPQPYWEPAEDCYIVHYAKLCLSAYGEEDGWDEPVGLPAEIQPLTRPFGLYAGQVFTGRVLVGGKPAAGVPVEIEFWNEGGLRAAPTPLHATQVVRADERGVFSFSAPWAGWWGCAALTAGRITIERDGKEKPVEEGAVLWMEFSELPQARRP
ncbi:MAG: DUF4198 domain-containing protein [Duodenibacillus sp.]|nr:DUF4198 domain-containing protein [Duodenibacillus sp.]